MKRIFFIGSAFFILTACNNGKDKKADKKVKYSDLIIEDLKGNISSYEETPYQPDSMGKIGQMDSCCIGKAGIDGNGNYIKWSEKDSKGTLKSQSVYERFDNGLWKGSTDTKEGKTSGSMETKINDKDEYTSAMAYDSAGKPDKYYTNITQNEYGQVTGWKEYDKDSVFRQEYKSDYNKNLQMAFTMKDSTGGVKSAGTYIYNDKGEQTDASTTSITKDSTTTKKKKYTYDAHDDKGNWTLRTEWDDKGKATKITKREYTYNKKEE